jgi:hypothetical protein
VPNITIDQWEDETGIPIVIFSMRQPISKQFVQLRVRDLPLAAIVFIINWVNTNKAL